MHHGPFRALSAEYRDFMELSERAWAQTEEVRKWLRAKKVVFGRMKEGDSVPEVHIRGYVQLLIRPPAPDDSRALLRARSATLDYMSQFGVTELTPETAESVLNYIAYPPTPARTWPTRFVDYLERGTDNMQDVMFLLSSLRYNVLRDCPTNAVPSVVRWLYVRIAQCTPPFAEKPSQTEADAISERYMGISRESYTVNAVAWRSAQPWTIVRAWHRVGPVGVSIVLPLTPRAYLEVIEGRKTPYDCTPDDFMYPSHDLILEAVVENPDYMVVRRGQKPIHDINPMLSLRASTIAQICALSRCNRFSDPIQLRIAGFAGTSTNETRMRKLGFRATGKCMRHPNPKTRLQWYEKTVSISGPFAQFYDAAALDHLGSRLPERPPAGDD